METGSDQVRVQLADDQHRGVFVMIQFFPRSFSGNSPAVAVLQEWIEFSPVPIVPAKKMA
jgi:hypothetical protein